MSFFDGQTSWFSFDLYSSKNSEWPGFRTWLFLGFILCLLPPPGFGALHQEALAAFAATETEKIVLVDLLICFVVKVFVENSTRRELGCLAVEDGDTTLGQPEEGMTLREKNVFFRALPKSPPPWDPNSGNMVLFFGRQNSRCGSQLRT